MLDHPLRLLWLLPLLFLGHYWLRRFPRPTGVSAETWNRLTHEARPGRMRAVAALRWLALVSWLVAWAGPRWGVERIRIERSSYDIVFAVDCSRSMLAEDLVPSRKLAARQELAELIRRLEGNRFGLVGFTDEAFVFCPLTRDGSSATLFLEQLEENSFPRQGTNLGKALEIGASLLPGQGAPGSRVVILLSDGEDRLGKPVDMARQLAKKGIIVHTVAIGSPEGAPIPLEGGGYHKDTEGKTVITRADQKSLQEIASTTGGRCIRLSATNDHLDPLIAAIQEQERRRLEQELSSRKRHQFSWFIALGLLLLGFSQLILPRYRSRGRAR